MNLEQAKGLDKKAFHEYADKLKIETRNFIDGKFVDAQKGRKFENINPATGEAFCAVARSDAGDVDAAVKAARKTFKSGVWSRMAPRNRMEVLYKFAATYFIATALWAFSSPPAHAPMRVEIPPRRSAVSAPPTALSPERLGNIEGRVAEPGGAPAREALVWIAAGLEGTRFAQRADPVRLENDGRGFSPRVAAAQVGQPLLLRATDGHLHSLKATADQGRTIAFNVAVLASGAWREVTFDRAFGPVALDCTVHHEHGGEERAEVVVLDHPFFATTSEDGRFRFEKVPAGRLRLAARSGVRTAEATLVLDPRTTAEPILRLSW